MKLWTLQKQDTYEQLKDGNLVSHSTNPVLNQSSFLPISQEWFIKKTGFDHWPIWCWLSTPNVESIIDYKEQIKNTENKDSYLLELNIPNNEKMVFVPDSAWHYIANYWYLDNAESIHKFQENCFKYGLDYFKQIPLPNQEYHEQIQKSWDKIFDLTWCEQNFSNSPIRVCITSLHPHWLEKSYALTTQLISNIQKEQTSFQKNYKI